MDFDNKELGLGLGLSSTVDTTSIISMKKPKNTMSFEPSLTLAISGETNYYKVVSGGGSEPPLCRQESAASSFSIASVKREREVVGSEEGETTTTTTTNSRDEDDDDGVNGKKKLRLTKAQSALLEESFKLHSTLNPQKQKQELARELKLRPRQVEVWFQNRRARSKLKQTEVDCEYLKKCCETLKEENRGLQKELQELKAIKLPPGQPFYMQLPATTLTICPSCERIGDTATTTATATKSPFTMAPKPHLVNPFASPSAAC